MYGREGVTEEEYNLIMKHRLEQQRIDEERWKRQQWERNNGVGFVEQTVHGRTGGGHPSHLLTNPGLNNGLGGGSYGVEESVTKPISIREVKSSGFKPEPRRTKEQKPKAKPVSQYMSPIKETKGMAGEDGVLVIRDVDLYILPKVFEEAVYRASDISKLAKMNKLFMTDVYLALRYLLRVNYNSVIGRDDGEYMPMTTFYPPKTKDGSGVGVYIDVKNRKFEFEEIRW